METILIVDDSSTVRKFLTATLKTRNFRCIEASDGVRRPGEAGTEPADKAHHL
jgi:DNA-binding response OmpR family regulator